MDKKKQILLAIGVLLLGVLVTAGSYSYWSWISSPDNNIEPDSNIVEYVEDVKNMVKEIIKILKNKEN